jgi:hypothetical protein
VAKSLGFKKGDNWLFLNTQNGRYIAEALQSALTKSPRNYDTPSLTIGSIVVHLIKDACIATSLEIDFKPTVNRESPLLIVDLDFQQIINWDNGEVYSYNDFIKMPLNTLEKLESSISLEWDETLWQSKLTQI